MKNINAFVACAVIAITSTAGAQGINPVQWTTASGGNGHWYELMQLVGNSQSAEVHFELANSIGGYTATIGSSAENQFCLAYLLTIGGDRSPFIGVRKQAGTNQGAWVTGEAWSFTRWHSGEGSNSWERYAMLKTFWNGDWQDTDLTRQHESLVEWSADCNADGIVDYGQCLNGTLPDYNGNNIPDCCDQGVACVVASYAVQWRLADGGNGHWYAVLPDHHLWSDAKIEAEQLGGYLATTTSNAELLIVGTLLPFREPDGGYGDFFIGASRASNTSPWQWVTGEPFEFTAWIQGQPDNGPESLCLEIVGRPEWPNDFGKWNDEVPYAGGGGQVSIIEWSADCNNDGLVDYGQILNGQLIDTNGNGVPDVCEVDPCPGDISGNNAVDGVDLAALLGMWGTSGQGKFDCDIDNDGLVGGSDLAVVLSDWGPCPN